uniref:Prolactin n=1 Tax=Oryzias sinensis TaxID=183150 RepID=A0A8C7YB82_9TELE
MKVAGVTGEDAEDRVRWRKLIGCVLCSALMCKAVDIPDLLDRASQRSDKLHSLSNMLALELVTIGRVTMPRPAMCHTSSLLTPNDKEQALQVSESTLMSLARSLLKAWQYPVGVLSNSANLLPHQSKASISNKLQELQEHSRNLEDGLDVLSGKMGPTAQILSTLPYRGGSDLGQDKMSKLINFNFLLSCLRRDSHKIDSFLKVLRCRAANMQPNLC